MKKFIQTIQNIFKIEELRSRLAITFLLVVIYRFGSFVALPGIDTTQLANLTQQTEGGLMMLLDMPHIVLMIYLIIPLNTIRHYEYSITHFKLFAIKIFKFYDYSHYTENRCNRPLQRPHRL